LNAARKGVAISFFMGAAIVTFIPEPLWIDRLRNTDFFWHYAWRATPIALIAIGLALLTAVHGRLPRTPKWLACVSAIVFIATLVAMYHFEKVTPLRQVAGLACLAIALHPVRGSWILERIGIVGRHSYGIYLSHVIFLRFVVLYADRRGIPPSITLDLAAFAFAFIGAATLSMLLAQSKLTRWTLGE
jgi:peptidoglycan/LPS O-acetylase OafA/YrhL